MDSKRNQNARKLTICLRPGDENNNEDFRSVQFKDSPIIVLGVSALKDNEDPYTDVTHPLVWSIGRNDTYGVCWFCSCIINKMTGYYLCEYFDQRMSTTNTIDFHKECIEPIKNNPYHLKHSLQILIFDYVMPNKVCYCCNLPKECLYYCFICNFSICRDCSLKPILLTINHKKRHEHTLSYFSREASMTCDVCGLDDRRYFIYVCHYCDFIVHKECVYLPYTIKITRHEHRLSFVSSFLPKEWFCGICRKKVNENYGGYSCVKGCCYVAHSKCATHENVWDGKELDEEPEEIYEDISPLRELSDGIIQHFSHNHNMRLHKEIDKIMKDNIYCQACALPIFNCDIFSCMECNFVLHKVCAYFPLKKQHTIHLHPLVLQDCDRDWFVCSACSRIFNGFMYKCQISSCRFTLDVNCAAVTEPLNHHCHPHLLFLPSKPGSAKICSSCQELKEYHLDCEICDFVFCFSCVILPIKFRYKHDKHPLILSYEKEANDHYWCEVCEKEIYPKNGIYMCNECSIGLHIGCLFGSDMYLLPGKTTEILPNNRLTRFICSQCNQRCAKKIFFKGDDETICSVECLRERGCF